MGVIYHLRYPLLALDLLHEHVVGDLLVFQSLLRGSGAPFADESDYPFTETGIFDEAGYPRMHFIEHEYAGDPRTGGCRTAACAEAMLRSAGFVIVEPPGDRGVRLPTRRPERRRVSGARECRPWLKP
jgi:tRNA (mo5U34)-methyltransferase